MLRLNPSVLFLLALMLPLAACSNDTTEPPTGGGNEIAILAGQADGFMLPAEQTSPSPEYLTYLQSVWPQHVDRQFDSLGFDRGLAHSFLGWSGPVCGARLEIRLFAGYESSAHNDALRLSMAGDSDPLFAFHYWSTIANIIGSYSTDWWPGDEATIILDLDNLPATGHGGPSTSSILNELADGQLEILVEDDSHVDYAILYICQCPVPVERTTWGGLKSLYR